MNYGDGLGADLVLDAVGISVTLKQSMEVVRPNGQITKIGWGPDPVGFTLDPLIAKAVRLQGSFSHNYPMWEKVLLLMGKGTINPMEMTKIYKLDNWKAAFDEMDSLQHAKSIILPNA
jgi:alcohol dehydrogenase/L-iditol 2-dehydrogenase